PERCVLRVWDLKTGRELRVLKGHGTLILRVVCSADGRLAASHDLGGELRLWDLEGKAEPGGAQARVGKPLHVLRGHSRMVTRTLFLPDGQLLSIALDGTLRVWNVASGREDHTIRGQGAEGRVALVPGGQQL